MLTTLICDLYLSIGLIGLKQSKILKQH